MRARQVINVDIISILAAVALDHNRLALKRFAYENRYHQLFPHTWSIRDTIAQDRERLLVELPVVMNDHLGSDFAGGVDMPGVGKIKGLFFSQQSIAPCAGIDPNRAGEKDPADFVEPSRFEHIGRSINV